MQTIFFRVLICLVCIFALLKPEVLWKYENKFLAKNGNPSKQYIVLIRISASLLIIAQIISIVQMILA
ncbi:MAG: hypothetical protein R3Y47_05785 [Lachnospiraceae bacterium]